MSFSISKASLTSCWSSGLNKDQIWSTPSPLDLKWAWRMSGVMWIPEITTPQARRRRFRIHLKTCFQSLSQVKSLSPMCRSMNLRHKRSGYIGDSGDNLCLKVSWMKAEPCWVSPSEAIKTMWSFVVSHREFTPLIVILITVECSGPVSHLQSPEARMAHAGYMWLSLQRILRAAIVA